MSCLTHRECQSSQQSSKFSSRSQIFLGSHPWSRPKRIWSRSYHRISRLSQGDHWHCWPTLHEPTRSQWIIWQSLQIVTRIRLEKSPKWGSSQRRRCWWRWTIRYQRRSWNWRRLACQNSWMHWIPLQDPPRIGFTSLWINLQHNSPKSFGPKSQRKNASIRHIPDWRHDWIPWFPLHSRKIHWPS